MGKPERYLSIRIKRVRYFALVLILIFLQSCQNKPSLQKNPSTLDKKEGENTQESPKKNQHKPRLWNDAHTHLSPLTIETFVKVMDENGIRRVVNMSGGSRLKRRKQTQKACSPFPGRIANFANVDWSNIDDPAFGKYAAQSLREASSLGFAGLKISKALGLGVRLKNGELLKIDDPRLDPLWREAGKLGMLVAIHTSDPKAFFEPIDKDNERYAELSIAPSWSFFGEEFPSRRELLDARNRVIKKHPKTTFMLLHFANNPEDIDSVEKLLSTYPNTVVDVAARLAEIGRHDPQKVKDIFRKFQNRIIFATDIQVGVQQYRKDLYLRVTLGSVSKSPPKLEDIKSFYDLHAQYFELKKKTIDHPIPIQGDWKIQTLGLAPKIKSKVYYENSERLIFSPWLGRSAAQSVVERTKMISKP